MNRLNKFLLMCASVYCLSCSSRIAPSSPTNDLYPAPSGYSTVLYASQIKVKDTKPKIIASHAVIDKPMVLEWEALISEGGEYDVFISYSARNNTPLVNVNAGKVSLSGNISATSGVFDEANEWYHMNYERKLLPGKLDLTQGRNVISLRFSDMDDSAKLNFYSIELLQAIKKNAVKDEVSEAIAARPDMSWFTRMKYGVMFHWTAQSAPRAGTTKPYRQAVQEFDVDRFVEMVKKTGAEYVIFTGNHAEPHFPAPLKAWEKEYPGQTTTRDLIDEIASKLKAENIRFILYLATHIYARQEKVSDADFERINMELINEIGHQYKDKIDGYWLDGFYQSIQNHPHFDFRKFYQASKAGNSSRLLALNTWLYPAVTLWQDYWAGEVYTPSSVPSNTIIQNGPGKGLPFHSLIVLENDWVHDKENTPIAPPRLTAAQLIPYIASCSSKGPVTINLGIYQDGTIGEMAMAEMEKIRTGLSSNEKR